MNSFAADGHGPVVRVRTRELPEIADTDWISLTEGITVLTGRNNVGKTRILQAIADLAPPTETDSNQCPAAAAGMRTCIIYSSLEVISGLASMVAESLAGKDGSLFAAADLTPNSKA